MLFGSHQVATREDFTNVLKTSPTSEFVSEPSILAQRPPTGARVHPKVTDKWYNGMWYNWYSCMG